MEEIEKLKIFVEELRRRELSMSTFNEAFGVWDCAGGITSLNVEGFTIDIFYTIDFQNNRSYFEVIGKEEGIEILINRLTCIISEMEKNIIKEKVKLDTEETKKRKRIWKWKK